MAFPQRYTRHIHIEGTDYVWHLTQNTFACGEHHITIRDAKIDGQILYLDPYSYDLEIRPKSLRAAILRALQLGWMPHERRAPMYLGWEHGQFMLLPPGIRLTHMLRRESS